MINEKRFDHRKGTKTVKIFDDKCAVPAGREVEVRQMKHEFLFGCAEFSTVPYASGQLTGEDKENAEKRYEKMLDIFNSVTLPFYWGRFEPDNGRPDTERLLNAAKWLKDKGMTLKGHTLCWHTVCADWLMDMDVKDVHNTLMNRINREVTGFRGLIDMWDVINEPVIMPIFDKYDNAVTRLCKDIGRIKLVREVFEAARNANPNSVLLINDFETSESYDILIEGLLSSGVKIDAIGIQSHMHQGYWGVEKTQEILERFSRFGIPLHFTENTLVSGEIMPPEIVDLNDFQVDSWPSTRMGEERQAAEAASHYETLFAHPMVASATWWSFCDGLWLNAPAGLVTKAGEVKPAYEALHGLIKDKWWTGNQIYQTDENGEINVTGYRGEYEAVCDGKRTGFFI